MKILAQRAFLCFPLFGPEVKKQNGDFANWTLTWFLASLDSLTAFEPLDTYEVCLEPVAGYYGWMTDSQWRI